MASSQESPGHPGDLGDGERIFESERFLIDGVPRASGWIRSSTHGLVVRLHRSLPETRVILTAENMRS